MLDVRRMKVLREVAHQGSFSAAAEALSFTQSAVSQHIAALERETGARLVERGPRGVRLTDAGQALVCHTDAILARIDDAEEELAAIAGLREGRLRLASFQSAGATLVPRAVASFRERHPGVELGMIEAEPAPATVHPAWWSARCRPRQWSAESGPRGWQAPTGRPRARRCSRSSATWRRSSTVSS